jgi:flagellar protein FliO/FliZ
LFGVGLFILSPIIHAQDDPLQEGESLVQAQERDPRAWERNFSFDDEGAAAPDVTGTGASTWTVVRMVLTLALAAAAIYGVVFFIKRSSKKTVYDDPFLKILASAALGQSRYVHIVAVGSKAWLLGSSDGGVNLIGEIEDKDVLNAMLLEDSKKSGEIPGRFPDFLSVLRSLGVRLDARAPGADEIRKRRERLKGL